MEREDERERERERRGACFWCERPWREAGRDELELLDLRVPRLLGASLGERRPSRRSSREREREPSVPDGDEERECERDRERL